MKACWCQRRYRFEQFPFRYIVSVLLFFSQSNRKPIMADGNDSAALAVGLSSEICSSVDVALSVNFGRKPGSSSCICKGCYNNCLVLQAAAFGENIGDATNPCCHLVDENGVNIVNKSASRFGRISLLILNQVLGTRFVKSVSGKVCADYIVNIHHLQFPRTRPHCPRNNIGFDNRR